MGGASHCLATRIQLVGHSELLAGHAQAWILAHQCSLWTFRSLSEQTCDN